MGDAGRHHTPFPADEPASPLSNTRMSYIADLLLELKEMATVEGHTTLAGLLSLAYSEALAKSR
jgi:hypothetical protein